MIGFAVRKTGSIVGKGQIFCLQTLISVNRMFPKDSHPLSKLYIAFLANAVSVFNQFQFNPSVSINPDIHGFKRTPTLDDKIHCVCFVIDGSTVNVLSEKMLERIKAIKSKIHQKGKACFRMKKLNVLKSV